MATLSVCMIVKDEEDVLERCLKCLENLASEIIIVDTGSKDRTKEIAYKYTDKVYDFKWCNDFSKARNFSFKKANMDYIMWVDADDVITKEHQRSLKKLITNLDYSIDVVMLKYDVSFDENNNPTMSYYRERILKRTNDYEWEDPIHEVITPSGKIVYSNIAISHRKIKENPSQRNLNIYRELINNGISLSPRQLYYYARELYYNSYFDEAINAFDNFLKLDNAWVENKINACQLQSECYLIKKQEENALHALYKSFNFSYPRAEICCDIGNIFLKNKKYEIAAFWYEIARNSTIDETKGGFYLTDCYGYIPNINLAVCYYNLGDNKLAEDCNLLAEKYKPNDINVMNNKTFFNKIKKGGY